MFTYKIIKLPAYRGVGLKWDGAYSEVSNLKQVITTMSNRVEELDHVLNPDQQLGLSYHLRPDGFIHYSVYEVTEEQQVPEGMVEIYVPEMTYLVTTHPKGESIGETYAKISSWMEEGEYEPFVESDKTYFDSLPIKHERYPANRDLENPHFDILIPITKKHEALKKKRWRQSKNIE
ncbi:GyrI-like domain-containing protein [Fredinandcohnia sp. 179-A 10B2 NHS]